MMLYLARCSPHQHLPGEHNRGSPNRCVGTGTTGFHLHHNERYPDEFVQFLDRSVHQRNQYRRLDNPAGGRPPWLESYQIDTFH